MINARFGSHPYLQDFVENLSEWFCDGFIEYAQYLKHGMVRERDKREILKNKALNKWWNFIDKHQKDQNILLFLKETSKVMKADVNVLQKMLK